MSKFSAADALALPVPERLQLVEDIWNSIGDAPHALELTEEDKRLIDERLEARRKLRPRPSRKGLKKLDLLEFAKARPPQDCIGQWIEPPLGDITHCDQKRGPLLEPPPPLPKPEIGFHVKEDSVPYPVKSKGAGRRERRGLPAGSLNQGIRKQSSAM
jgi:putative addiction module component (TIGR02574 family)